MSISDKIKTNLAYGKELVESGIKGASEARKTVLAAEDKTDSRCDLRCIAWGCGWLCQQLCLENPATDFGHGARRGQAHLASSRSALAVRSSDQLRLICTSGRARLRVM
jgi:hypothetical protein